MRVQSGETKYGMDHISNEFEEQDEMARRSGKIYITKHKDKRWGLTSVKLPPYMY